MSRSVKSEIDRRTTDAGKLAALEARKVAVLELVADLISEAVTLMKNEGFTAPAVVQQPYVGAAVIREASIVQPPAPQVKNPCANCGQEAVGTEDMPNGSKKFLCRAHYQARLAEKQESETTKSLMGNEGTLYVRPQQPTPPVKKILIQHSDPLLGNSPPSPPSIQASVVNGQSVGPPPPNNVLGDD